MAACISEQAPSASVNVARKPASSTAAGKPTCWQHRLLGKQLARCSQVNNARDAKTKPLDATASLVTEDGRPVCEIIGMYFSFVNPGATCDDFTRQLVELYASVNADNGERRKRFEVVHVVLWSNVTDVLDFEESFRAHVADLPWLAVPNNDYERKTRLTRRYRIKAGVPTLILLEGSNGSVVTRGGVERTVADPAGAEFPWRPPHPKAALEDGPLLPCGGRDSNEPMLHEELRHCFKGVYFSAHWCPPCKAFTPQLVDTYQRIRERGHDFEVIFVSSDRSEDSYNAYTETMPWLKIPFSQEERRRKLARALDVQAIPTLVILDPRDNIITLDGRTELIEDPEGLNFPWTSRLVNILTEKYATSLHDAPAIILFVEGEDCEIQFGESVLLPTAQAYRRDRPDYDPNYDDPDDDTLQFYIALDCETSDILREFIGLDDAVPLLTAIDIPRGIYVVMEDGAEITVDSVQQFVDGFLNNKLPTNKIAAVRKTSKTEHVPA
ncbi:PREDICTED: nucleoredoxin-like [Dinoponera quadriceps]|uniref:Nucleoredoxin-like n=1 Tax=Dinoponera quadriceps TaxID=609295 RepID=A0A6P3WRS1_DINQU|nr:PREDICTED: nucleoredoxin-like [Dinoponera quadriceps]XP_014468777.1 PREDICTED: nucleoredoxin-like [Dinoponera quadriceps]XP_014468779.1 PREDICTED: nucleoredoxin-like [Dinoponera quadriceps]